MCRQEAKAVAGAMVARTRIAEATAEAEAKVKGTVMARRW